jgi:hypothetical protein
LRRLEFDLHSHLQMITRAEHSLLRPRRVSQEPVRIESIYVENLGRLSRFAMEMSVPQEDYFSRLKFGPIAQWRRHPGQPANAGRLPSLEGGLTYPTWSYPARPGPRRSGVEAGKCCGTGSGRNGSPLFSWPPPRRNQLMI